MKESSGIIISTRDFENSSLIVTILSKDFGIIKGLAKGAKSKKNNFIYQIGNHVNFSWFGRENSLGIVTCEIIKSFPLIHIQEDMELSLINLVTLLVSNLFIEGMNINKKLLPEILVFFALLSNKNFDILEEYFYLESQIIEYSGYHLENSFDKTIQHIFNILHKKIPNEIIRLRKKFLFLSSQRNRI